jgi:hypothetical protein
LVNTLRRLVPGVTDVRFAFGSQPFVPFGVGILSHDPLVPAEEHVPFTPVSGLQQYEIAVSPDGQCAFWRRAGIAACPEGY